MKLSAPPPPPPPPSDGPPAPSDETPGANAPGSPDAPASETPEPPPFFTPKPLAWPAWYAHVDAALAGLVLVFAFAAASFVARNSDVWLHLAAGKRLLNGQYTPGSDPFSYSAADRPWVNHSWLTDAAAYLLYGGEGKVLVIAKALVVALAFGFVIAIRRPKFPLWSWAVVACVAVLAAAPYFVLRPLVVSMLFLAVTLFLVFRLPQKSLLGVEPPTGSPRAPLPTSWRLPGAIGVTFWLWANSDPWFFVGPMALALLIVGDLIQAKFLNGAEESDGDTDDEPLGRLPDTRTLAKALAVGVLACMLNPHHIRVWELPFELVGAAGAETDPRVNQLLITPLSDDYHKSATLGGNVNGWAYAVLFVGGAAVLGFGYGRLRVAHVALWIGFGALSLLTVYAIPLFAVVAVPLVAAQLNAFAERAELKSWGDPKSRVLLIGSSLGRIACVLAVCGLCVLAYPGWVHPDPPHPSIARRIAWGVEPEPSLRNAAEQFHRWHEAGRLPADAHGVIANVDLANYVAWFAPQEKVFFNARYNHHRPELPDFIALRKALGLFEAKDYRPSSKDAAEVLGRAGAEYVAFHADAVEVLAPRSRATEMSIVLFRRWEDWSVWYVDGRTTVFGWHAAGAPAQPTFAALRVDPTVLAFGPDVKRLPEPELKQPLTQLGWEEAFVRPARPGPVGAAEALAWARYKEALIYRQQVRSGLLRQMFFGFPALPASSLPSLAMWAADGRGLGVTPVPARDNARALETVPLVWFRDGPGGLLRFVPPSPLTAEAVAAELTADVAALRVTPLLALRAARRAVAEDPDHPDPYYALAQVLKDPDLPLSESERALGMVTAYRQCLDRLPPPDQYRKGLYATSPTEVALNLADIYLGRPVVSQVLVVERTGKQPGDKPVMRVFVLRSPQDMPVKGPDDVHKFHEIVTRYPGFPIDLPGVREQLGGMLVVGIDKAGRPGADRLPVGLVNPNNPNVAVVGGPTLLPLDVARETIQLALRYAPVEWAGDLPAEELKKRVQGMEAFLKELEGEVVRANDRHSQVQAAGQPLPALVDAARYVGLPGKALKLLSDKDTDVVKEYKEQAPQAALLRVTLELAIGRLENASEFLTDLTAPESAAAIEKVGLAPRAQQLRYQKALLAGDYKTAGELWEALAGGEIGALEKVGPAGPTLDRQLILAAITAGHQTPEPEKVLAGLLQPPVLVPLHPLMTPVLLRAELTTRPATGRYPITMDVWKGDWIALENSMQQRLVAHLEYEVTFFYKRGVLSLLEGDIPAAKRRFQQSERKPPKGWGLPNFASDEARQYLRLIEAAEKRAAAP